MNRQQRRQNAKMLKNVSKQIALDNEYIRGYNDGQKEFKNRVVSSYYAATALAMKDLHNITGQACVDTLKAIETNLITFLTHEEMVEEVLNTMGIEIEFDEAIDKASYVSDDNQIDKDI